MRHHYTYCLIEKNTGEFYIGSRSTKDNISPEDDKKYLGSMVRWKPNKKKLVKRILSTFKTRTEAFEQESELIKLFIKDPLNRNYFIPSTGFNTYGCEPLNKYEINEVLNKIKSIHGNKYDYSQFDYSNGRITKIKINCLIHGEFITTPGHLLTGKGCRKCGLEKTRLASFSNTEKFIEKANKKHNNKYDYSLINYNNQYENIKIICPSHGEFEQKPKAHLAGQGCSKCRDQKFSEKYKFKSVKNDIILNTETGIFYESISEASYFNNLREGNLRRYLNGERKNKTSFIKV
jgi:hypothetical protein